MATATPPTEVRFAFEDVALQTFVVRSRSGGEYHLIQPVRAEDPRCVARENADGEPVAALLRPGDLGCTCKGSTYRGSCWATAAALERMSVDFGEAPGWNGAGAAVEAARG